MNDTKSGQGQLFAAQDTAPEATDTMGSPRASTRRRSRRASGRPRAARQPRADLQFGLRDLAVVANGRVGRSGAYEPTPAPPRSTTSEPTDAAVGHPLLAAYQFTRKYGLRETLGDANLRGQQLKVEALLNAAARLLEPLGISRNDLEGLLARKLN